MIARQSMKWISEPAKNGDKYKNYKRNIHRECIIQISAGRQALSSDK
jgi:hypothetical protein